MSFHQHEIHKLDFRIQGQLHQYVPKNFQACYLALCKSKICWKKYFDAEKLLLSWIKSISKLTKRFSLPKLNFFFKLAFSKFAIDLLTSQTKLKTNTQLINNRLNSGHGVNYVISKKFKNQYW